MTMTGELYALATALLWSASTLVFAGATRRYRSIHVNIVRLFIAEVFLGVWLVGTGAHPSFSGGQIALLMVSGVVGLAMGDSFLFRSFQEIGPRLSMLLMSTAPAIAALCAALVLHERLSLIGIVGMFVTLAGIAGVIMERTPAGSARITVSSRGVAYGLLAASGQGLGLIFAKIAFSVSPIDGFMAAAIRIFGGCLVLVPLAWVTGRLRGLWSGLRHDGSLVGRLTVGAFVGSFLGIAASLASVSGTTVGVASTIMATVPVILLPLEWVVYGDRPSLKATIGALVAVTGVALLFLG